MRVIDSHAHLEEIPDVADALRKAKNAGVAAVIAVGTNLQSNRRALELARGFPNYVFPALGLVNSWPKTLALLTTLTTLTVLVGFDLLTYNITFGALSSKMV